jgi:hypothetical protein
MRGWLAPRVVLGPFVPYFRGRGKGFPRDGEGVLRGCTGASTPGAGRAQGAETAASHPVHRLYTPRTYAVFAQKGRGEWLRVRGVLAGLRCADQPGPRRSRRASAGPARGTAPCHPRTTLSPWRGLAGIKRVVRRLGAPSRAILTYLLAISSGANKCFL